MFDIAPLHRCSGRTIFFPSKYLIPWTGWAGKASRSSTFFSSPKHTKKTATQITPTATQFNFWVAETAMQNFDSKFIPVAVGLVANNQDIYLENLFTIPLIFVVVHVRYWWRTVVLSTVLSGAEERGVQCRSRAPFLIFSIPADLRSYLRSKRFASMKYKAQTLHTFSVWLFKPFLSSNS